MLEKIKESNFIWFIVVLAAVDTLLYLLKFDDTSILITSLILTITFILFYFDDRMSKFEDSMLRKWEDFKKSRKGVVSSLVKWVIGFLLFLLLLYLITRKV